MSLENKSPILAGWCNRDERENKLLFFRVLVLAGHDRNPFPVVPAKAKTSALEDRSFDFLTTDLDKPAMRHRYVKLDVQDALAMLTSVEL